MLLLSAPSLLLAHAVVTGSSLAENPVPPQTATSVLLQFNSDIELALSQVFLVSQGDEHQTVRFQEGKEAGQLIIQLPPLAAGEYALRYKVFAADGHLTEDVIHFKVSTSDGP